MNQIQTDIGKLTETDQEIDFQGLTKRMAATDILTEKNWQRQTDWDELTDTNWQHSEIESELKILKYKQCFGCLAYHYTTFKTTFIICDFFYYYRYLNITISL